jgi:hypothetical protein
MGGAAGARAAEGRLSRAAQLDGILGGSARLTLGCWLGRGSLVSGLLQVDVVGANWIQHVDLIGQLRCFFS